MATADPPRKTTALSLQQALSDQGVLRIPGKYAIAEGCCRKIQNGPSMATDESHERRNVRLAYGGLLTSLVRDETYVWPMAGNGLPIIPLATEWVLKPCNTEMLFLPIGRETSI
ncbi:hypothetical protein HELRODRAFT_177081 [Helobdella robusta]|uniref:Uncharacterized protein n=1 Tax=Helobdella robusta TaxID=6412 RepID=T1FB76_HELRO|nr:hypothetical protein HELRODRAFT_177081 [Helobdella robusta]ESN98214.1 hypothetical protein HELRODRAFT_177081 [Helobdella robusta]